MNHILIVITALTLAGTAGAQSVSELNEAELKNIDTNNDGFLSQDEFNAFSDYAFQAMDEDKNGTLGLSEAKPFLDLKQFQAVDRDGDSLISKAGYATQMQRDFEAADQDGNGRLD